MILCRKCKTEKDMSEFVPSQISKGNSKCKACQKEYSIKNKDKLLEYNRKYYLDNKDQLNIAHKEYYKENKDHLLEWQKNYLQNNEEAKEAKNKYNKEYSKRYINKYMKMRSENDPCFRLRNIVSRSIRAAIKRNNFQKKDSCLTFLSYSIQKLKEHLEKQFEPWMNWSNQGRYDPKIWNDNDPATWVWQLDHIVPQSALPYSSIKEYNFQKCWCLSNLRPLSAKQNILDKNRK
jgi:hypothetical protein